jgi:hypothetical protein
MPSDTMCLIKRPGDTPTLSHPMTQSIDHHVSQSQPRYPASITTPLAEPSETLKTTLSSLKPKQLTPPSNTSIINHPYTININPRRLPTQTIGIALITTHQICKTRKTISMHGNTSITRSSLTGYLEFCSFAAFVAFGVCELGVVGGVLVVEVGPEV